MCGLITGSSHCAGLCSRTKLQRAQRFFQSVLFSPQLSQTITNKLEVCMIRTHSIRKLSMSTQILSLCMLKWQCVQSGALSSYSNEQFLHHFMTSSIIYSIKTAVGKLSMILFKSNSRLESSRSEDVIYGQCSKSDNPADLDTFKLNDLGFMELAHCCNKEKHKKAKEVHRY